MDDARDARFLIRVIMEEVEGVELVGEADGAEAALEVLDEAAPDVALIDAMMPLVDGYALAPKLRERVPGCRLVLLTSHVDPDVEERAREAGFDRVVDKEHFTRLPEIVLEVAGANAP